MKNLIDLVQIHYPMSVNGEKIFKNSLNSFNMQSNNNMNYETQDPLIFPVFVSKIIHELEEFGIILNSLDSPVESFTWITYINTIDGYIGEYHEEELITSIIADVVDSFKNNTTMEIWTIMPYVNINDKRIECHIRGRNLKQN